MTPLMPVLRDPPPLALLPQQAQRKAFRVELFMRRGFDQDRALAWADKLTERDADRDDRRLCVECSHLQLNERWGNKCFAVMQKRERVCCQPKFFEPVLDVLQRCHSFQFVTP